nr:hypothetical protein [Chitinophaga silvisoli]
MIRNYNVAAKIQSITFSALHPFKPAPQLALNSSTNQPNTSLKPRSTTTVTGK